MLRKIVSLTALLSFLVTVLTSFILYVAPQGRVAYWSDWSLWGLGKTQWGNLHINLGTLFLLALVLHIYYNWKPITAYLSKARKVVIWTREFAVALLVTVVVGLGTYLAVPPFSSFLALSEQIKDTAARTYGEPPYGHAELSTLASLAQKTGTSPETLLEGLKKAGYPAENASVTLLTLSRKYGVSPQRIYTAAVPPPPAAPGTLPASPPQGTGTLPLKDLCARHGLDAAAVLAHLAAKGITAKPDMTLKQIAEANQASPLDVYALIREAAAKPAN